LGEEEVEAAGLGTVWGVEGALAVNWKGAAGDHGDGVEAVGDEGLWGSEVVVVVAHYCGGDGGEMGVEEEEEEEEEDEERYRDGEHDGLMSVDVQDEGDGDS